MDRLGSYIARHDPSVKTGDSTDNIVVLETEKSISNKNEKNTHLVFSHKPAAEVFKNPELLASAKLARAEIKQQLIATGVVTNSNAEKILDNIKYNSVTLDKKGYGKDVENVIGSTSFHYMTKALKLDTAKIRFKETAATPNAGTPKSRAKRGTGIFQPAVLQTGRSSANHHKNTLASNTPSPQIREDATESEESFMFSTFPSELETDTQSSNRTAEKTESHSASRSMSWINAKPSRPRPQASPLSQPMTSSSSIEKKS